MECIKKDMLFLRLNNSFKVFCEQKDTKDMPNKTSPRKKQKFYKHCMTSNPQHLPSKLNYVLGALDFNSV